MCAKASSLDCCVCAGCARNWRQAFKRNASQALSCAASANLYVIPSLFDHLGNSAFDYDSLIPTGRYRTTEWVASPGQKMLANESSWGVAGEACRYMYMYVCLLAWTAVCFFHRKAFFLFFFNLSTILYVDFDDFDSTLVLPSSSSLAVEYVSDVVSALEAIRFTSGPFQGDPVIPLWDVINQPVNTDAQLHQFVRTMASALKSNSTSANRTLTCAVIPGGAAALWDDVTDVYSFVNYNGNRGAVGGRLAAWLIEG